MSALLFKSTVHVRCQYVPGTYTANILTAMSAIGSNWGKKWQNKASTEKNRSHKITRWQKYDLMTIH